MNHITRFCILTQISEILKMYDIVELSIEKNG